MCCTQLPTHVHGAQKIVSGCQKPDTKLYAVGLWVHLTIMTVPLFFLLGIRICVTHFLFYKYP